MLTEAEIISRVDSRFQFRTPAKGGPNPARISVERYGQHASYVTDDGERVWGFTSYVGRGQFAADYRSHTVVLEPRKLRRA